MTQQNSPCEPEPLLLSKQQVADALNVSLRTVNQCIHDGLIPVVRLRRRVLVPRAFLTRLVSDSAE